MTRARTYGHSIDNEGRSGLRGCSCNSHPGLARSRGGERRGREGGRGFRALEYWPRGYSVFTENQIHERVRGYGMLGVASVRRTRSNGRAECCAGGGSRGEGVVRSLGACTAGGSKWTRQSAVWEGQKAIGRRLGELWVDIWQPNTVAGGAFVVNTRSRQETHTTTNNWSYPQHTST